MIHTGDDQPDRQTRDIELRVCITPGRADAPWHAVIYSPDEERPLGFDQPETLIEYLRRRWVFTGLR